MQVLSEVLSGQSSAPEDLLIASAATAAAAGPGGPLSALPGLARLQQVSPPPLPAQELVDLLAHPLCVGKPRRLVLHQLARHYRPFTDQWDFVDHVHQQGLGLDLGRAQRQR